MEDINTLNRKIALQFGNIQMLVLVFFLAAGWGVFYSLDKVDQYNLELQQYKEAIKNPEAVTSGHVHNN